MQHNKILRVFPPYRSEQYSTSSLQMHVHQFVGSGYMYYRRVHVRRSRRRRIRSMLSAQRRTYRSPTHSRRCQIIDHLIKTGLGETRSPFFFWIWQHEDGHWENWWHGKTYCPLVWGFDFSAAALPKRTTKRKSFSVFGLWLYKSNICNSLAF